MRTSTITLALLSLAVAGTTASAQTTAGRNDSIYTWRGALKSGALLTVRNVNGPIEVRPSNGTTAELRAEKRTRGSDGDIRDVEFEIQTSSSGDVTICSTFRGQNPCDDGRRDGNDNDNGRRWVSVAMTILVPRGAQLKVVTGNGAVSVERVGADVQATTGNGRVRIVGTDGGVRATTGNGEVEVRDVRSAVRVTTGNGDVTVSTAEGPVQARTGNGDIDVRMSAMKASENMSFSTGHGNVRLTIPASYNGELDASTGNGEVSSDFDLKLNGRVNPRHIRATIGSGGATLRLSTGNGRLELRKAN
ncbi:MAG: DUF4097 family beta strand repeat protein [Gemmatimonadaceae bacterium]|nr:DUF4097 family beta strand repeat protein [Gemmatimonadaceae bacterium]